MTSRRVAWTAAAAGLVALSAAAAPSFGAPAKLHFGKPVVVDAHLAGGEPSIFWDPRHQDFIYSSHEGTTHTLRDGLAGAAGTADFTTNYRNQVNIWTSKDGRSWSRVDLSGTGFEANPSTNQGFSDPDLTQDAGGRVYNTGIDLVNDALFSSPDGGRTWDRGTINCHDGDRPWLAAGPKDTVWLANDPNTADPSVWISTDGGSSCSSTGIADPGGYGKLFYDSFPNKALHGALIEPVPSLHGGIGRAGLKNTAQAFTPGPWGGHGEERPTSLQVGDRQVPPVPGRADAGAAHALPVARSRQGRQPLPGGDRPPRWQQRQRQEPRLVVVVEGRGALVEADRGRPPRHDGAVAVD